MSCKTFFFWVAVVAVTSPLAFAGDLTPCACDPRDAAMSGTANSVDYGKPFTTPPEGAAAVHPGVVIATLAGPSHVKVAVDSAKADAEAPDTVLFDFTGQGKFSEAFSTPLRRSRHPTSRRRCSSAGLSARRHSISRTVTGW